MRRITKLSIAAAVIGIGSLLISYIGGPSQAAVDNTRDCDTVAIFYCGSMTEAEFHKKWNNDSRYKDHAAVYNAFGIKKADVTGMIDGVVWRDGRVTLADGTLVATNAMTAGRWNNPTSDMTRISGTSRAYKISTRHFVDEGQTAMIKMVDGQFKFAVIKSCGNPVVATPKPKPVFSCDLIKATVDPNNIYKYTFTINATAKGGAKVYDYVINFGDGTTTKLSKSNTFTHTYAKAGSYTIKSSVRINLFGEVKTVTSSSCQTKITIKEAPVATCDALDKPAITNRTTVKLTSHASTANGATISEHIFTIHDASGKQINQRRVATTAKTASSSMVVPTPGSYTAKVAIRTSLGDIRSADCEQNFKITPEPPKPAAECKLLDKPVITDRTNVALRAQASVSNGATIQKYVFTVAKNGTTVSTKEVTTSSTQASTSFNIEEAGSYTAKVAVHTSVGVKSGDDCEQKFKIVPPKTPDVSVDKKVENVEHKKVGVNVEFDYQIRVTNTGETDLKNVTLTDKAPKGVTFLSASAGKISNGVWTHTLSELKRGDHADFTITAKVPEYLAGTIKNTVCVDTPDVPGQPDDCDDATVEVPKDIIVCVLDGKKYPVTIKEEEFDSSKHSLDPADCEEEKVEYIKVCVIEDKKIITIDKKDFDSSLHTTDLSKCEDTPPELPKTGAGDNILDALGLGALVTSVLAYGISRRHNLVG